jgi:hypothetical protein
LAKPTARSRITNGKELLPGIDGRSLWARRFRDILALHISDLGGETNCSEAEKALARRAACLIVELERIELRFADPEHDTTAAELHTYQQLANSLRRILESLHGGLERRAAPASLSLGDVLRSNQRNEARP